MQAGPRYPIDPLIPYVEQGYQLLTPNQRLARLIKAEWSEYQRQQGLTAWQPVSVAPLEGWLLQQWQQRCLLEPGLRRSLLSPGAARALWLQVIRKDQSEGAYTLLQPDAAADLAQQAHNTLLRWYQSLQDEALLSEFEGDADCSAFLRWATAFEERLAAGGLASRLDAITLLVTQPPAQTGPPALLIEFDDIPPLYQRTLALHCRNVEQLRPAASQPASLQARACDDRDTEL